jgi:hypothetical protein
LCFDITGTPRPGGSAAWDIGAYSSSGGGGSGGSRPPAPPTVLSVVVE